MVKESSWLTVSDILGSHQECKQASSKQAAQIYWLIDLSEMRVKRTSLGFCSGVFRPCIWALEGSNITMSSQRGPSLLRGLTLRPHSHEEEHLKLTRGSQGGQLSPEFYQGLGSGNPLDFFTIWEDHCQCRENKESLSSPTAIWKYNLRAHVTGHLVSSGSSDKAIFFSLSLALLFFVNPQSADHLQCRCLIFIKIANWSGCSIW